MKERIFISYKRANKDIVFKIKDDIESNVGEKCWIDLDDIKCDANYFVDVISKSIDEADVFLFMYSKKHAEIADFENDWAIREINYAQTKKKRIIFLNLDGTLLTDWFVMMFGLKQQVDVTSTTAMSRLYSDFSKWLESKDSNIVEKNATTENGHEYVDLGLPSGLKWATCNVGATKPEEYGTYFAWGEVEPKNDYSRSIYKYGTNDDQLAKYCNKSSYGKDGFTDNKTVLDPEDDAASVNWGGNWRMPTVEEFTELREQCTWTWTTQNGVNGYKVVGKNGNFIFLPAAGFMYYSSLYYAGSYGFYWSCSLNSSNPHYAYCVSFSSSNVNRYNLSRYYGQSVRPVCQ